MLRWHSWRPGRKRLRPPSEAAHIRLSRKWHANARLRANPWPAQLCVLKSLGIKPCAASQYLFGGPSILRRLGGIPKAWFKYGSSTTSQSWFIVSRLVREWSEITRSTARNANTKSVSLLRRGARLHTRAGSFVLFCAVCATLVKSRRFHDIGDMSAYTPIAATQRTCRHFRVRANAASENLHRSGR
jgi:hypothetical protein